MPELPEVEVLVRHLEPLLRGRKILTVEVRQARVLASTPPQLFSQILRGARFLDLSRRGKYLLFTLRTARREAPPTILGHLGMTGRMYLASAKLPLPKHAAVVFNLGRENFIYEDTRYFGKLTLDLRPIAKLGPEPLGPDFTVESFAKSLKTSSQAIKVKLLDQSLIAGVGNIYASEALFRAGISPRIAARRLRPTQLVRLWQAIREVLADAISSGSSIPLDYPGNAARDRLFYFGSVPDTPDFQERFHVYDRHGLPCHDCGTLIKRLTQAARSTYFCPNCQKS
jgi:formamidopyrimidine-DNA glycosylase